MSDNTDSSRCPFCGTTELLTVSFEADEGAMLFRVCPPCEERWWERDGDLLDLSLALPHVAR